MFNDSIDNNLAIIEELMQNVPPSERGRAKKAAVTIEKAVTAVMKDNKGSPAAGLGMAFAVFTIAQRLVAQPKDDKPGSGLIQLLS